MAKTRERRVVHLEELIPRPVIQSLNEGTDLACALICGAYIENATGSLLEKNLIDDPLVNGPNGILNGPTGILSSASGRADLCFCLGLIDEIVHKNLKSIAKVRNWFAHSPTPIDFTDVHVKSECEKLHFLIGDPTDVGVFAGQLGIMAQSFRPVKPLDKKTTDRIVSRTRHRLVFGTCWTLLVLFHSIYAARGIEEAIDDSVHGPKRIEEAFKDSIGKGKTSEQSLKDAVYRKRRPNVFESTRSFLVTHNKNGKLFFDTVVLLNDK